MHSQLVRPLARPLRARAPQRSSSLAHQRARSTRAYSMAQPNIVFYDFPLAFNPGKARLALVEKGLPYKGVVVDLFNGASLAPSFIRINPKGTTPVLVVDGGAPIIESKAIVEAVDMLGSGGPLGGDKVDRSLVKAWVDKIDKWDGNLYAAAGDPSVGKLLARVQAFKEKYAAARAKDAPELADAYAAKIKAMQRGACETSDAAAIKANFAQLDALLDEAEAQLGKTPYLAGAEYSIADVMFTPVVFRTGLVGKQKEALAERPKLTEYWQRIKARPSYQQVFGPALSKATALGYLLPALAKSVLAGLTGRY